MSDAFDLGTAVYRAAGVSGILDYTATADVGFGIGFLDAALGKMLPTDLILIGGRTKQGKSQLAVEIAKANAMQGKNVIFIALEAEHSEIEMRLMYQIVCSLYYDSRPSTYQTINYRKWRLGQLNAMLDPFHGRAMAIFGERYHSLKTVYATQGFTHEHLNAVLDEVKDDADLIIIDHFHYFDMGGGRNVNEKQEALMKRIRDLNLYYQKPILLLAHLNKTSFDFAPDVEQFMGTSNIGKIATGCIMVTRNTQFSDPRNEIFQTVLSIPTCRTGAILPVGIHEFSTRHQGYSPLFELALVKGWQEKQKLEPLPRAEWPDWARDSMSFTSQAAQCL